MQEGSVRQDAETWLRYLTSKTDKQLLDLSALNRLTNIITKNPEYKELFAALLIAALETERENHAIMVLHIINTIVYNFRLISKDTADAEFLGKILDLGLDVMERHLSRDWKEWENQLGKTLLEWKLNYKIENRLTPSICKLMERKEKEAVNLKDVHNTLLEVNEGFSEYLKVNTTEAVATHMLRVWEFSFRNAEPNKEPYRHQILNYTNAEGWQILINITRQYLVSMLTSENNKNLVFRNIGSDKLAIFPQVFVTMHAATFIESIVGACVRALVNLLKTSDTRAIIKSPQYKTYIVELISFFKYTLENMHSLSPYLSKFICEVCNIITEIKGTEDYWNELNGLLILKLLAPYVSNPVMAGIVEYADLNAVQLLTYTAKIIQHCWVGKQIENGDLSELVWLNEEIPKWKIELQRSFERMYRSRKGEPRTIALPKTLILYDLSQIKSKLKDFEWTKIHSPPKNVFKKPEVVISHTEGDEIEENIEIEEEINVEPVGSPTFKEPKLQELKPPDPLEDSTPSMQTIPAFLGFQASPNPKIVHTAPPDIFKTKNVEIIREETKETDKVIIVRDPELQQIKEEPEIVMQNQNLAQLWNISKYTQTNEFSVQGAFAQTEIKQVLQKSVQTEGEYSQNKPTQTDLDMDTLKMMQKFEVSKLALNKETYIDPNLIGRTDDEMYLKTQVEKLQAYQAEESERLRKINDFWANQFKEVKDENIRLKQKIKELEEMPRYKTDEEPPQGFETYRTFSHRVLREELVEKFLVRDENLLKKCDPYYYLGIDDGARTVRDHRSVDFDSERYKRREEERWKSIQTER
ncbi:unnamed protein product [Blepharisma stoltei]|uniref:Uncharacterized protein n=1 Tax=Blepharisma stoltei TaxID=1481888 RepID=A0AAU9J9M0_9CILI|nr:unnamed protein product [Blepharisma stoltei]